MPEEERLRLQAMAERIALVRTWVAGMDEAAFLADLMARDAVALSILVIGETARRLSQETIARAEDIPWSAIVSVRNRIPMATRPSITGSCGGSSVMTCLPSAQRWIVCWSSSAASP